MTDEADFQPESALFAFVSETLECEPTLAQRTACIAAVFIATRSTLQWLAGRHDATRSCSGKSLPELTSCLGRHAGVPVHWSSEPWKSLALLHAMYGHIAQRLASTYEQIERGDGLRRFPMQPSLDRHLSIAAVARYYGCARQALLLLAEGLHLAETLAPLRDQDFAHFKLVQAAAPGAQIWIG